MTFLADPKSKTTVYDPEKGWKLSRFIRDVPKDERWYRFDLEGVNFLVKSRFFSLEEEKSFKMLLDFSEIWSNFNSTLLFKSPKYSPTIEEFKEVVIPALTEALICLHSRLIRPRLSTEGWKIQIEYTNRI